jgi:hypothetical protein
LVTFHRGWQEWLAECLMQNMSKTRIADRMVEHGFDRDFALIQIREAEASPFIAAGRKIARRRVKLASLYTAMGELYRQSDYAPNFKSAGVLAGEDFYANYFYRNIPVLVDGLMCDWPALKLWSPRYFAEQFGDLAVEITADRNQDSRYEDNLDDHRKQVAMKEFVRMIEEGETNDCYLVARNYLLERPELGILKTHFDSPAGFLNPEAKVEGHVKLWLGPKGTVTPVHHDATNIFFGQVYGRKHIKLVSPYHLDRIYNDRRCFSDVNLDNIDYEHHPLMRDVPIIDVIVEPGQFLFLPVGWWHWVKSLEPSISLSFQNFYFHGQSIVWRNCY